MRGPITAEQFTRWAHDALEIARTYEDAHQRLRWVGIAARYAECAMEIVEAQRADLESDEGERGGVAA